MPDTAKILRFPLRSGASQTPEEGREQSRSYLEAIHDEGADERRKVLLTQPDVLQWVCARLGEQVDASGARVWEESVALYRCIASSNSTLGAFDERDYFLGETALLASIACRVLGKRSEAELWLDRAEAGFRHTVNPTPVLANVTYQRLALRCEMGRYDEVCELAPMLAKSFAKLNMLREQAKCVFLEGVALKESGRHECATVRFEWLLKANIEARDPGLVGLALVNLADMHAAEGRDDAAAASYTEALPLLKAANRPASIAHLKNAIAENLRRRGRLADAIKAYGASAADYEALGMSTWVAYIRVVLAQTFLEAGQPREAEWQILAALPTIEEQKMAPEGFAAMALLRESIRQRKTDPKALLELREYLQAKN